MKEEFSVGEHEKKHTINHKRTFELNETELLVSTAAQSRYLLGRYVVNINIKPKPFLLSFFSRNVQCRKKNQKKNHFVCFFIRTAIFLLHRHPFEGFSVDSHAAHPQVTDAAAAVIHLVSVPIAQTAAKVYQSTAAARKASSAASAEVGSIVVADTALLGSSYLGRNQRRDCRRQSIQRPTKM